MQDGTFFEYIRDVYVTARADSLEQEKAKALKRIQDFEDDDSFYFGLDHEISQMIFKVGSFKMESIFPPTTWLDLGHDTPDEAGGDKY